MDGNYGWSWMARILLAYAVAANCIHEPHTDAVYNLENSSILSLYAFYGAQESIVHRLSVVHEYSLIQILDSFDRLGPDKISLRNL